MLMYLINKPTVCAQEEKALHALHEASLIFPYIHRPDNPVYPVTHHRRQCSSMTLATVALNCIKGPVYTEAHPIDRGSD